MDAQSSRVWSARVDALQSVRNPTAEMRLLRTRRRIERGIRWLRAAFPQIDPPSLDRRKLLQAMSEARLRLSGKQYLHVLYGFASDGDAEDKAVLIDSWMESVEALKNERPGS